jgi:hypothetical protein
MTNDDELTPSDVDVDFPAEPDDELDAPAARARTARRKRPAAKRRAPVVTKKAEPKVSAAKTPMPSKKAAKGKAGKKKPAKAAVPPAGLTRVQVGGHVVWVTRELARVLTAKDRKKLRAVLKRAEKREAKKATK